MRRAPRIRRHGQPPHARRPARQGHDGQGAGKDARRGEHHRQQEHHSVRGDQPVHHQRHPHRHAEHHLPRIQGGGRAPDCPSHLQDYRRKGGRVRLRARGSQKTLRKISAVRERYTVIYFFEINELKKLFFIIEKELF